MPNMVSASDLGDIPPVEVMSTTEAKAWMLYLCKFLLYDELWDQEDAALYIELQHRDLMDAVGLNHLSPGMVLRRANTYIERFIVEASHNQRQLALQIFREDLATTEEAKRLARRAAYEDPEYINELMAVLNRRAKYLGLDGPERIEILIGSSGPNQVTETDMARARETLEMVRGFEQQLLAQNSDDADSDPDDDRTDA